MDNKPQQKSSQDSWKDENDKLTNPNRRQEEDQEADGTPSRSGQRASNKQPGSTDTPSSDRLEESELDREQSDTSRRQPQTEE